MKSTEQAKQALTSALEVHSRAYAEATVKWRKAGGSFLDYMPPVTALNERIGRLRNEICIAFNPPESIAAGSNQCLLRWLDG